MANKFSARWNLPDESDGEKIEKYINRLVARVGETCAATSNDLKIFAFIAGLPVSRYGGHSSFSGDTWFEVRKFFSNFGELHVLAKRLEDFLNSPILSSITKDAVLELTNQSHTGIRIVLKNKKYQAYPEGEPKLDAEVVEAALNSLEGESAKEYSKALKEYSEGNWEQSSEKTRRTLEEYARSYLNNTAGLQANIPKLGAELKARANVSENLRNAVISQLKNLDKLYNLSSKHWSKTDGHIEAEYLIYSVGVTINTLEKIKSRDKKEG